MHKKISKISSIEYSLQIQTKDTSSQKVTDREEIARLIAKCNLQHFAQAGNTPLANYQNSTSPTHSTINLVKKKTTVNKSQQGANTTKEMDVETDINGLKAKFVESITEQAIETTEDEIKIEDWIEKFKKLEGTDNYISVRPTFRSL